MTEPTDAAKASQLASQYIKMQQETSALNRASEDHGVLLDSSVEKLKEAIRLEKDRIKLLNRSNGYLLTIAETAQKNLAIARDQEAHDEEKIARLTKESELLLEMINISENKRKIAAEQAEQDNERREKAIAGQKELNETVEKFSSSVKDIGKSLLNIFKGNGFKSMLPSLKNFLGSMGQLITKSGSVGKAIKNVFSQNAIKGFGSALSSVSAGAVDKMVQKTKEMVLALDAASTSMAKLTGGGENYNDNLQKVYGSQQTLMHSVSQLGKAQEGLFRNMTVFSSLSKESQKGFLDVNASMEKIGVTNFPETVDVMTRAMGRNVEQAKKTGVAMVSFAKDLGVPASVIMKDFQAAAGNLAKYGNQMTSQFKKLAAVSKTTGVSVQAMLGITGKFDTYESGAQSVAKLNAVMGGPYLNTVNLMKMSDDERIKQLVKQVKLSGLLTKKGDRFTKMALTQAIGASSAEAAMRLLNMSQAEQLKNQQKAAKEESMQKAMANLREAAYKTIPVMEKIGLIMLNIFSESGSASEVLKFIEKSLIPGLETFARVARSVWEVLGLWIFAIPIMLKLVGVFITMLPALANMTAAIAASGAAIAGGGAAGGVGLTAALTAAMPLILKITLVAAGFAAVLLLIASASTLFFDALGDNIPKLAEHGTEMFVVAGGIVAIGYALAAVGIAALPAIAGIGVITAGVVALGSAMKDLPQAILNPENGFTRFVEVSTELTTDNVDNVRQIVEKANAYHKGVIEVQNKTTLGPVTDLMGGQQSAAQSGHTQLQPHYQVILEVDGDALASGVFKAMDKTITMQTVANMVS
jgi:hypothetical protein